MRILFSVHGYKPAWRIGGPIISVSSLAESLVAKGHEVTVFTTNSNQDEDLDVPTDRMVEVDGVRVRYFRREEPLKSVFPRFKYLNQSIGILYAPEMAGALAQASAHVDLMHTHIPFVYPTFATSRAAFRARLPHFYHQRGVLDPEHLRFRALKKRIYLSLIEKPILRRATTLIALTEAERDNYAALGISTPCTVIPNGIALPGARDTDAESEALRRYGIGQDHTVVLFMSRLHPTKGADRLLDAFLRIASQRPQARLVLAGPDEFALETSFRTKVAASGLADSVIFTGMVTGTVKEALLHRADLFCLPSDAEGFSMAILEALAHATPVLISPRCHFPEVVTAGAGIVVEPSVNAISDGLLSLLAQPMHLKAMGQAGLALVARDYTWRSVTAKMLEAYEEGIDRHARGH